MDEGLAQQGELPSATTSESVDVAVLMAVYGKDDPTLFDEALRSIEEQNYPLGAIRLYLAVDGPLSASLENVLREHKGHVFKLFRNQHRKGLAASLNALLDLYEGEQFVFRMDSDDYSYPSRFHKQVAFLLDHEDVSILGTAINEVNRSGHIIKTIRYPKTPEAIKKFIARRSPLAHPTVCFRRSAIEKFGRYPEVPVAQDVALWFRCIAMGLQISNIDDVLLDLRVSNSFYKRRGGERALQEFQIYWRGIWNSKGLSWRLVFPLARLAFRCSPVPVIRLIYKSRLR